MSRLLKIKLQKCKEELNDCRKMLAQKDKDILKCTKDYAAYKKANVEELDFLSEIDEIGHFKIIVKELTKENKEKQKCDKEKFLLSVKCRRYQATIEKLKEEKEGPKKPR